MCGASAERNLYMKKVLPSVSCAVWEFQNSNWVFSCISQPMLVSLVCLLCCLLCSSSGYKSEPFGRFLKQIWVIKVIKGFPDPPGLGSGHCLRQGKWFFTQHLRFPLDDFFGGGRQSTHDKVPLFMEWSRGERQREFVWHRVSVERKELQGVLLCLCVLGRRAWQRRGGCGGTLMNKMSPVKVSIVFLHSVAENSQQCWMDGNSPVKWRRE